MQNNSITYRNFICNIYSAEVTVLLLPLQSSCGWPVPVLSPGSSCLPPAESHETPYPHTSCHPGGLSQNHLVAGAIRMVSLGHSAAQGSLTAALQWTPKRCPSSQTTKAQQESDYEPSTCLLCQITACKEQKYSYAIFTSWRKLYDLESSTGSLMLVLVMLCPYHNGQGILNGGWVGRHWGGGQEETGRMIQLQKYSLLGCYSLIFSQSFSSFFFLFFSPPRSMGIKIKKYFFAFLNNWGI